jgi:hypothetical protein
VKIPYGTERSVVSFDCFEPVSGRRLSLLQFGNDLCELSQTQTGTTITLLEGGRA